MTTELTERVRALSHDARAVLNAFTAGPLPWRSVDDIAGAAGLTPARTRAACRELGALVCSPQVRPNPQEGYIVHGAQVAVLAADVAEIEPRLPIGDG